MYIPNGLKFIVDMLCDTLFYQYVLEFVKFLI